MTSFFKLFPSRPFIDVLLLFCTHPDEEIYQSRIVSSTGTTLMQVQRALKRLEETGLITKSKQGNRIYYSANRRHPAFEDIKRALFKTIIFDDILKKAFSSLKNKIQFCFIYGSVARAEESFNSDIDLFIVTDLGIRDLSLILGSVSQDLGREINPTIYPIKELIKKINSGNNFITSIIQGPKIWIIGEESELAKIVK